MKLSEVVPGTVGETRDGMFLILKVYDQGGHQLVSLIPYPNGEIEEKFSMNIEFALYSMEFVKKIY